MFHSCSCVFDMSFRTLYGMSLMCLHVFRYESLYGMRDSVEGAGSACSAFENVFCLTG